MSSPRDYLSVCAIFRDEGPYLREWIEFHKLVGVTRFFLYDNGSTDESRDVLAPYVAAGDVELEDWPGVGQQNVVYRDCVSRRRDESRWIAFIDLDEFVFSPTGRPLPELLVDFEAFPGVGVNWVNFGTSGHVTKPRGLVIENYLYARDNPRPRRTIKTIADPRRVARCHSPHFFYYVEGSAVNERKQPIRGALTDEPSTQLLRVNHYVTKSEEERRAKVAKGKADSGRPKTARRRPTPGRIRDETILMYLPRLREALGQASYAT
jgi:Glycosyltransferase family 92